MTSAEAAFLGIAIGAVLSLLGAWLEAHAQWKREEQQRRTDRLARLYVDTLVFLDNFEQRLQARLGPSADWPEELDRQRADWNARIILFGSKRVNELWGRWVVTCAKSLDPHVASYEQVQAAKSDLIQQMRTELGSPPAREAG